MDTHSFDPFPILRRIVLVLVLLCILGTAGALYFAGELTLWAVPGAAAGAVASPTPRPPTGRRWFYEKPLWQQPEEAR